MRNNTPSTLTKNVLPTIPNAAMDMRSRHHTVLSPRTTGPGSKETVVSQSSDRTKTHSPTTQICHCRVLQGRNFIAEGMRRNGMGEMKYSPTLLPISTAGKTQHLSRSGF